MSSLFKYRDLGQAVLTDAYDNEHPIEGCRVYEVSSEGPGVLGLAQINPSTKKWRAVASLDGRCPKVNLASGLWSMTPGRSGFDTRREASIWLMGVRDRTAGWFADEIEFAKDAAETPASA